MNHISLNTKPDVLADEIKDKVSDMPISKTRELVTSPRPKFGSAKDKIKMAADFDAPLDEFREYIL